jgi:hypothetical protein
MIMAMMNASSMVIEAFSPFLLFSSLIPGGLISCPFFSGFPPLPLTERFVRRGYIVIVVLAFIRIRKALTRARLFLRALVLSLLHNK